MLHALTIDAFALFNYISVFSVRKLVWLTFFMLLFTNASHNMRNLNRLESICIWISPCDSSYFYSFIFNLVIMKQFQFSFTAGWKTSMQFSLQQQSLAHFYHKILHMDVRMYLKALCKKQDNIMYYGKSTLLCKQQ